MGSFGSFLYMNDFFGGESLSAVPPLYASLKTTDSLLLSVIVNRIELVRLPFSACAWHGRGINGRYWMRFPGDTPGVGCDGTRGLSASRATRVVVLSTKYTAFEQVEGHGVEISREGDLKYLCLPPSEY